MIYETGYTATLEIEISESVVSDFARFSGDINPLHINSSAAHDFGFARPVAHGAILVAALSRIIGTELPGTGAIWMSQNLEWLQPVYVGETVTVTARVEAYSEGTRILTLSVEARTERDELAMRGHGKVKISTRVGKEMTTLRERIAFVSGASGGIGAAVAKGLASEGFKVILGFSTRTQEAEAVAASIRKGKGVAELQQGDMLSVDGVTDTLTRAERHFGGIDTFIHCATGSLELKKIEEISANETLRYAVPYIGSATSAVKTLFPYMKSIGFGRIVFLGTEAILGSPPHGYASYVIGKQALWGFTKSCAMELGAHGITTNMVSPSLTVTELTASIPHRSKEVEARKNPMRRLATPEDTASAISYITSLSAGYINGCNLPVTGKGA